MKMGLPIESGKGWKGGGQCNEPEKSGKEIQ
jgi:hypothetical protein